MRVVINIDDYTVDGIVKEAKFSTKTKLGKKKIIGLLAQNIVDRYFGVEYFGEKDYGEILSE